MELYICVCLIKRDKYIDFIIINIDSSLNHLDLKYLHDSKTQEESLNLSITKGSVQKKKTVDIMNLALFPFGPPSHHK